MTPSILFGQLGVIHFSRRKYWNSKYSISMIQESTGTNRSNDSPMPQANSNSEQVTKRNYWYFVALLAVVCSSTVCTRILQCQSEINGVSMPFFSANDRSRWCTVRALVDHGTYAIDDVLQSDGGENWGTIDKVRHLGSDGSFHYYSSKPPLLPTIMAGGYWVIKKTTGKKIAEDPQFVIRSLLLIFHVPGFFIGVLLLGFLARQICWEDGAAAFVVVCGAFGTYLTTFSVTFSNHLPAAFCVLAALCCVIPIWQRSISKKKVWAFFLAGFFAAMAAANDLPAASFLAVCLGLCFLRSFSGVVLGFVPGALIVIAAFFGTNYFAHETWEPAYAHRQDGEVLAQIETEPGGRISEYVLRTKLENGVLPFDVVEDFRTAGIDPGWAATVTDGSWPTADEERWIVNFGEKTQSVIAKTDAGFEIRRWKNWYEFPNSYWLKSNKKKSDVDRGTEDRWFYLMHATVGHHGVVSLTPIWLLVLPGFLILAVDRTVGLRFAVWGFIAITLVVFAFYVRMPAHDRNYGGWTSCFRWAIWMYPIWLVAVGATADFFWRNRFARYSFFLLLFLSIVSATIMAANPWSQPWLEAVLESMQAGVQQK